MQCKPYEWYIVISRYIFHDFLFLKQRNWTSVAVWCILDITFLCIYNTTVQIETLHVLWRSFLVYLCIYSSIIALLLINHTVITWYQPKGCAWNKSVPFQQQWEAKPNKVLKYRAYNLLNIRRRSNNIKPRTLRVNFISRIQRIVQLYSIHTSHLT